MRVTSNLSILGIGHCLSILLSGCGGRSSSPLPPPISVSLSQNSATVQAGATASFTANVSNDSTNSGVKWSVSCPTAPCGTVSPVTTASGASTTYSAPSTPPTSNVTVVVVAASVADPTKAASANVTFPAISVSVSPGTAVVQAAATEQLAGTVSYDPSNGGVTWTVSCPTSPCGTLSANSTPSGVAIAYTAPITLPSADTMITLTATSVADASKSSSATLIPVGHIADYDVGVDYHSYGADYNGTSFITTYNQPQVRQTVQAQLQGMADRGATFLLTHIWFVTYPGTSNLGETWRATFPMTDQEAANLSAYAQDVAAIQGAGGNRLRLDIALEWLGASDYGIGSPTIGLGYNKDLSAMEFISRIKTTTGKVLTAVSNVNRPDGVRVVDTIYFDDEVMIPGPGETDGRPNASWFLANNYPQFISDATQAGIRPSVYFWADGNQNNVSDSTYVDSLYPILNGRRSMFWIYRSMRNMIDNGLPLPSRIDFSCYLISAGATYDQILQHILDDADATLPSLGAPQLYGAAETYYLTDPAQRLQYGQAFASQAALNSRLRRVSFWTTPDGGGTGQEEAYPFTIEDFLPLPSPPPVVPPISTVSASSVGPRPRWVSLEPQSKQWRLRPPHHPARLRERERVE